MGMATARWTAVALLGLMPGMAAATTTFGTLGNFDAVNDTGHEAHGFEIELEGIHARDVTDTFGGAGRGFPTTVERYGSPTVVDYTTAGGGFGARVTYRAAPSGGSWTIGTPTGIYTTPGESCWTGGGIGYGPATPCDHFGVGLPLNPSATHYSWLIEATRDTGVDDADQRDVERPRADVDGHAGRACPRPAAAAAGRHGADRRAAGRFQWS